MSNPYGNDPYGQQPPNPYGGAPGGGFNEPSKTDAVSITSLVLGLLCCAPVALILGFVGLSRTKGGQRKGRGMAIAGIVLGGLGLIVNVLVIIGLVAGFSFLASVVTPENAEVGQCVNVEEEDGEVLLREAECGEEHDGEIVAVEEVTEDNREDIETGMNLYCVQAIAPEDQEALTDYIDDLQAVIEDPNDGTVGDTLICYIEPDDKLDEQIL